MIQVRQYIARDCHPSIAEEAIFAGRR
jgi:hypothetical protein